MDEVLTKIVRFPFQKTTITARQALYTTDLFKPFIHGHTLTIVRLDRFPRRELSTLYHGRCLREMRNE